MYNLRPSRKSVLPHPQRHHSIKKQVGNLSILEFQFDARLVEERMVFIVNMLKVQHHQLFAKRVCYGQCIPNGGGLLTEGPTCGRHSFPRCLQWLASRNLVAGGGVMCEVRDQTTSDAETCAAHTWAVVGFQATFSSVTSVTGQRSAEPPQKCDPRAHTPAKDNKGEREGRTGRTLQLTGMLHTHLQASC